MLPEASNPPSTLLVFCLACSSPAFALDSIHSSMSFRGKTHLPVTLVAGILFLADQGIHLFLVNPK